MIASIRKTRLVTIAAAARRVPIRRVVEAVLIALLVVQAARLIWLFAAPTPAVVAPAAVVARPADLTIFQRFDAFFRTGGQSSLAEASGADSSQMRLYGVRSDGAGGGSAIIGLPDGRQVSVGVGEEVEPGLILKEAGSDFVTLSRGGSVSRLIFTETPTGAAPPPPPPATPQVVAPPTPAAEPVAAVVNPASLVARAGLRPRVSATGIKGFTVSGDAPEVKAAGLQAGDVVLSVNGVALNGMGAVTGLQQSLATVSSAQISYERDGQTRTTTIRTGQ